ncbi:MAG: glycogen-binding domain-containing protein, partial [Bacteroidia bacterium]|nr:glycogen-binding domain-containing protein [Bacteroidia bacterium]
MTRTKYLFFLFLLVNTAFGQSKIFLELPTNTPNGDPIYIAGNFQGWNPGKEGFQLQKSEKEGLYVIELNLPEGQVEFKFTRGSWTKVEANLDGSPRANRQYSI